MESLEHNLIYIRTCHTTTHLPFLSLAHNHRFFGLQSICLVPTAQGRASEPGCAIEAEDRGPLRTGCVLPGPAHDLPHRPTCLMSGGGEGGVGGQLGEGLNAVTAGRREDDSHTATLLPQCKCFCPEPFPGPPAEAAGQEQRGRACSTSSTSHLSTRLSPRRPR